MPDAGCQNVGYQMPATGCKNNKFYGKYFSDSGASQCREIDPV